MGILSVLVAAVAVYILGALWYSPVLFGNKWITLMGIKIDKKKQAQMKGKAIKGYIGTFFANIVMAIVLSFFVSMSGAANFVEGMALGAITWLGFLATTSLGSIFWEGRPFALYFLNISHHLVSLSLMGGILAFLG